MPLPSVPPSSSNKKRRFGSGEIPAEDIPFVEASFSAILYHVEDIATADGGKFEDLEELNNIRTGVTQILDAVHMFGDMCQKTENKGFDVKVCVSCSDARPYMTLVDHLQQSIPFSKFDHNKLSMRLGVCVVDIKSGLTAKDFIAQLIKALQDDKDSRQVATIERAVNDRDFTFLSRTLNLIGSSVNIRVRSFLAIGWTSS
jgi:hypothetical protein